MSLKANPVGASLKLNVITDESLEIVSAAFDVMTSTVGTTVSTKRTGSKLALPGFPAVSVQAPIVNTTFEEATSLFGVNTAVNTNGSSVGTSAPKTP